MEYATQENFEKIKSAFKRNIEILGFVHPLGIKKYIEDKKVIYQNNVILITTKYKTNRTISNEIRAVKGNFMVNYIINDGAEKGATSIVFQEFLKTIDSSIFAEIRTDNILSIQFFKRNGFIEIGEKKVGKNKDIILKIYKLEIDTWSKWMN